MTGHFRRVLRVGWHRAWCLTASGHSRRRPYSNQVIADATATAALVAYTGQPFITQLQYRNPAFAIYDIVAYDYNTINPGFVTLTLDRPWMEPGSGDRAAVLHLPALLRFAGQGLQEVDCDSGLHERSAARLLEHYAGRLGEHRPAEAGSVFSDQRCSGGNRSEGR